MTIQPATTAICCGGTGYKSVFAAGVLSALEAHGFRAAAYAGSSAAAIAVAVAASGEAAATGIAPWLRALPLAELPGNTLSDVLLAVISELRPLAVGAIVAPGAPRLAVATSAVQTVAGAVETQGMRAGALGRRLQVHADRHDRSWAAEHLAVHLWDSTAHDRAHQLTSANVDEALYASTRLLHACPISAEVDGLPYVDAVYVCACPAMEMAALDYREVIAVACEPGPVSRDLFQSSVIPEMAWRSRVRIVRPRKEPKALGVTETIATAQGLLDLYDHGVDQGLRFLTAHIDTPAPRDDRWSWPKRQEPSQ